MTTASIPFHITNWLTVVRLPFTTVGVVPFCAGIFIAYRSPYTVNWLTSLLGVFAVLFICISCYLIGEIYDQEEDLLTLNYGRSKFAGGTLLVANRTISTKAISRAVVVFITFAAMAGIYISLTYSSWLLFGLGLFGSLSAVLYSLPPVRLVKRGLGEILIGICYGWLPLVTGFVAASGKFPSYSWLFAWPVALSIFNVIFINEFPDYESDISAGKRNLVVRTGKGVASKIYGIIAVFIAGSIVWVWYFFRQKEPVFFLMAMPVVLLSLALAHSIAIKNMWGSRKRLEIICGLGILLNHLASISVAFLVVL